MKVGSGDFIYELDRFWGKPPGNVSLSVVAGLGIDEKDNIYILSRGTPPVLVVDKSGDCVDTWGDDIFLRPHALLVDNEHHLWGVDDHGHAVYKLTKDHKLLLTLGTRGVPSDTGCINGKYTTIQRPAGPFNRPTGVAIANNGNIYVTDGYGNCRIHVFSPAGQLLFSWGEIGNGPGQFQLPHGITIDKNDIVYVCDRQNNRVQLFDLVGNYVDEWTDFERPAAIYLANDGYFYVAECKRSSAYCDAPSRVTILNRSGQIMARLEQDANDWFYDESIGHHTAHSIVVDSQGNIYVGEVGKNIPSDYFGLLRYKRCR